MGPNGWLQHSPNECLSLSVSVTSCRGWGALSSQKLDEEGGAAQVIGLYGICAITILNNKYMTAPHNGIGVRGMLIETCPNLNCYTVVAQPLPDSSGTFCVSCFSESVKQMTDTHEMSTGREIISLKRKQHA